MLLMTVAEAAGAIGAKCGGTAPDADSELADILKLMTSRVEDCLEVKSLESAEVTDRFTLSYKPTASRFARVDPPKVGLRLTNAFLVADSLTITDPDGEELDLTDEALALQVRHELGIVTLYDWCAGPHLVTYTSGFEVDEETDVAVDVPDWMKAICIEVLVMWYRSVRLSPKRGKDIPWAQVDEMLKRDLAARIYKRYDRPRYGMLFGQRVDG
jgi:hypothetical protein